MSIAATNLAWAVDVYPASKKLVLLSLSHMLNGQTGQLNPSVRTIAKFCGLSEKQTRRLIHDLMTDGLLHVVANDASGFSKATRSYRLNFAEATDTSTTNVAPFTDNTPPPQGDSPLPPVGTDLSHECPSKLPPAGANRERTGTESELNLIKEHKRTESMACPQDVDQDVWRDFLEIRKAKRAPLTRTALAGIQCEADKAGLTLEATLSLCCARGWQSFASGWVKTGANDAVKNNMSFRERDELAKRKAWEERTGRKWPDGDETRTIDVTPTFLQVEK